MSTLGSACDPRPLAQGLWRPSLCSNLNRTRFTYSGQRFLTGPRRPSPSGGSAMSTIDHEAFFIDGAWRAAQSDDLRDHLAALGAGDRPRPGGVAGRHRRGRRRRAQGLRRGRVAPADSRRASRVPDPHGRRDRQASGRARGADLRGARLHAVPLAGLPGRLAGDEPELQRRDRPRPRHRAGAAQRPRSAGRRLRGRQHHPDGRRQPGGPGAGRRGGRLPGVQLRVPGRAAEGRSGADRRGAPRWSR